MNFRTRHLRLAGAVAIAGGLLAPAALATPPGASPLDISPIGTYSTGLGEGSGETAALEGKRLYVTNSEANSLDIVDASKISATSLIRRIDLSPYG